MATKNSNFLHYAFVSRELNPQKTSTGNGLQENETFEPALATIKQIPEDTLFLSEDSNKPIRILAAKEPQETEDEPQTGIHLNGKKYYVKELDKSHIESAKRVHLSEAQLKDFLAKKEIPIQNTISGTTKIKPSSTNDIQRNSLTGSINTLNILLGIAFILGLISVAVLAVLKVEIPAVLPSVLTIILGYFGNLYVSHREALAQPQNKS